MADFSWRSHADIAPNATEVAQQEMARCLSLAGMDSEILEREPALILSPNFCQWRAAAERVTAEKESLSKLHTRWTPKMQLVAIHRVIPTTPDQSPTYALSEDAVAAAFRWLEKCPKKAMSKGKPIKVLVGCYEPDHIVDEQGRRWQGSIHAVGLIKASTFIEAKACAHEVYWSPSSEDVYRPLVCKEVNNLPGAVQYAFKSMQFGSITTRARWSDGQRSWARNISLKAPERNELVRSMADMRPANRTICLVQ